MNIVRAAAGRPAAAVCMVGEGKKRDMKGDRGAAPARRRRAPRAKLVGSGEAGTGCALIFGLQGTTVRGENKARAAGERRVVKGPQGGKKPLTKAFLEAYNENNKMGK